MRQKVAAMLIAAALLPVQTPGRQEEMSLLGTNELVTYENTSVGGILTPPEECGDCFYTITEEPVKGSLCLQENGCYVYTPSSGRSGRDSFSYSLSDGSGSLLRETRVRIRIMEQSEGVYYEDMRGRAEAFAAARLSEEGLFTGEYLVGRYCFNPEKPVTRGEFLSICLSLSGRPILSAVQCTGRQDDAAIPAWMKGYVLSASLQGVSVDRDSDFDGAAPITQGEAAQMMRELLGINWVPDAPDAVLERGLMAQLLLEKLEE